MQEKRYMNVMVVGGGGREHAIIKKLKENQSIETIYALPGNGGIAADAVCVDIGAKEIEKIAEFAVQKQIDLAVVAPDDPLVMGAVDLLRARGIKTFGPDKKAAIIEGSKAFSKDLMKKYKIPTASYETFSDPAAAIAYLETAEAPIVIKADGLALGKGVVIAETIEEARDAVRSMMEDKVFGESGNRVVIEEFLTGPEVSVLAFTDGKTMVPMVSSMDHKRALDGDRGLNTAESVLYAGDRGTLHAGDFPPDDGGDEPRGQDVQRLPVLRSDADRERPEGHRIQLPLRRSGNAGCPAAFGKRSFGHHAQDL